MQVVTSNGGQFLLKVREAMLSLSLQRQDMPVKRDELFELERGLTNSSSPVHEIKLATHSS